MAQSKLSTKKITNKARDLRNSRDIYAWRVSDHPEIKDALQIIFLKMKNDGLIRTRYEKKYKNHIQMIVLDLYVAYKADPKMYITYSRNQSDYIKGTKYAAMFLSYRVTIRITDFLIKNKYIKNEMGYHLKNDPSKSRKPRMRASTKLVELIEKQGVVTGMIKHDANEEVIILRDKNKEEIQYNDDVKAVQDNLKIRYCC